ncbi:hypothetical protein HMPREF9144_2750 [Prevotella pallens ATCC 700821]|uniref:Uncharacterized protein n=1 Tax=Prevotella pallens ATCC 700821 TaxID=997353 RepID=F9DM58_9BACT|nr:hypothetical protein HMPREF9144_2750 [Prevotella pallens ATCC 700821]
MGLKHRALKNTILVATLCLFRVLQTLLLLRFFTTIKEQKNL